MNDLMVAVMLGSWFQVAIAIGKRSMMNRKQMAFYAGGKSSTWFPLDGLVEPQPYNVESKRNIDIFLRLKKKK